VNSVVRDTTNIQNANVSDTHFLKLIFVILVILEKDKKHLFWILVCDCNSQGSIGVSCDNEGKCKCKPNFTGTRCDQCKEGLYNFPICEGKTLFIFFLNDYNCY